MRDTGVESVSADCLTMCYAAAFAACCGTRPLDECSASVRSTANRPEATEVRVLLGPHSPKPPPGSACRYRRGAARRITPTPIRVDRRDNGVAALRGERFVEV